MISDISVLIRIEISILLITLMQCLTGNQCSVDRTRLIWLYFQVVTLHFGPARVCLLRVQGKHPVEHYNNPALRS